MRHNPLNQPVRQNGGLPDIAAGAHALVIKERLGHASITTTLDTYGHLLPSLESDLLDALEASMMDVHEAQTAPGRPWSRKLETGQSSETHSDLPLSSVGLRGFEPPTPGPPDQCANRTAPQPAVSPSW